MELVLDQECYLPAQAAAGAGARVTISSPGIRPNPADEGYYIKPRSEADISLRLVKVSRMPEPYQSKCWADWSRTPHKPLRYNTEDNTTEELEVYSYAVRASSSEESCSCSDMYHFSWRSIYHILTVP